MVLLLQMPYVSYEYMGKKHSVDIGLEEERYKNNHREVISDLHKLMRGETVQTSQWSEPLRLKTNDEKIQFLEDIGQNRQLRGYLKAYYSDIVNEYYLLVNKYYKTLMEERYYK